MNHLPQLFSRLYPAWWRKRYGDEFNALLDEARPGIGGALDILKGALAMQFSNLGNPLRILGLTTVLGLVSVAIFGLAMERQFRSTATLQPQMPENTALQDTLERFNRIAGQALSRESLVQIADDCDVYPDLNSADRLERMKEEIEVQVISASPDKQVRLSAFAISFSHPDRDVANSVVQDLTSRFLETSVEQTTSEGRTLAVPTLTVLDSASLPETPVQPAWGKMLAIGFVGGIGLGLVLILLRRLTRRAKLPQNGPPVPTES